MINIMRIFNLLSITVCVLIASSSFTQASDATHVTIRSLTSAMALKLANAAYEDCAARGYHVAVAVTGRDGRLLSFVRSPLSGPHTIEVSQRKAFTATTFKTSTTQLMERGFTRDIPGTLIVGGGLPINIAGHFYGGVGVSGAPRQQKPGDVDELCAAAGIAAVAEDLEMAD
jgi:uncharacterized protein GlcG (DUF336 family)